MLDAHINSEAQTSHASHNPTQTLNPCCQHPSNRKGESTAVKASRALVGAECKERQAQLDIDIDTYYVDQGQFIQEMAAKHKKPVKHMLNLIMHQMSHKKTRKPTLHNTIIHDMIHTDVVAAEGQSPKLAVLQAEFDNICAEHDRGYNGYVKDLSETEQLCLMAQLLEHHDMKKRGARASNKATAMDTLATGKRISDEMSNLFDCTGVQGFYALSHGNADDAAPHSTCYANSSSGPVHRTLALVQ
ncbi:hypothetical protein C8J57DRAFT_1533308 [Mycena rebaudengoi]|nr:hypothetical protein C8J57DRAFT_1533308 [Mycena rebaudengoi]